MLDGAVEEGCALEGEVAEGHVRKAVGEERGGLIEKAGEGLGIAHVDGEDGGRDLGRDEGVVGEKEADHFVLGVVGAAFVGAEDGGECAVIAVFGGDGFEGDVRAGVEEPLEAFEGEAFAGAEDDGSVV